MARTNNLSNFLSDIANAIRAKTNKTGQIQASQFDTEIRNIASGDELIAEYEITGNITANVVFDNLSITNGECCYIKISGHSNIVGMSVNELKGDDIIAHAYTVDTRNGGTNVTVAPSYKREYGMVGCLYDSGIIYIYKTSDNVTVAGIGDRGLTVNAAGFRLADEILTKITLYAYYNDIETVFDAGTKIQLYKHAIV